MMSKKILLEFAFFAQKLHHKAQFVNVHPKLKLKMIQIVNQNVDTDRKWSKLFDRM